MMDIDTPKAIVAAAAILGLAVFAAGEPRFQMVPAGGDLNGAYVLDRTNGTVRLCAMNQCYATESI